MIDTCTIDIFERYKDSNIIWLNNNAFIDRKILDKAYYENFNKFENSESIIVQGVILLDDEMLEILNTSSYEENQKYVALKKNINNNIEDLKEKLSKIFGYSYQKYKYYKEDLLCDGYIQISLCFEKNDAEHCYYVDISKFDLVNKHSLYEDVLDRLIIIKDEYCNIGVIIKITDDVLEDNEQYYDYMLSEDVVSLILILAFDLGYNDFEMEIIVPEDFYSNEALIFVEFV